MKKLNEISWQATEEEYRASEALHYSTLARFHREGFEALDKLFEPISSPSLTFGSMVDTYITQGPEEYEKIYMPVDLPTIPEKIEQIVKAVFNEHKDELPNLLVAPQKMILEYANDFDYYPKYKDETRIKGIIEKGSNLYGVLKVSEGKQVVTVAQHQKAMEVCDALKNSKATRWYFTPNPFEGGIERHFQLKFKANLQYGIPYACMFDLLIVNHNTKQIMPIDLKTTGKPEYNFHKSFIQWDYQIQARLYTRILNSVISKDSEYKDYSILPFKFVVVNSSEPKPLVWQFDDSVAFGELEYGKNIILEDPEDIGKTLYSYLKNKPEYPIGIKDDKANNLREWLNTL